MRFVNETKKRSPLGIIFLILFLDLVGFSIIFPLFPAMLDYYLEGSDGRGLLGRLLDGLHRLSGTSPNEDGTPSPQVLALFGGILGSLYSLLQFLFAPVWGRLSDRRGRRPILLLTVGAMALSYLVWFFSGTFLLLVVARTFGGIMSGNIAVATAAVADVTSRENRAKGMGLVGAAFGLGFILGPVLGGLLSGSGCDLSAHMPALAAYGVNPFSLAAAGAFVLSALNFVWVYRRFEETLPLEHRSTGRSVNPLRSLIPVDLAGVNRCNWTNFFFIAAFSGMEFSLMFHAADRFDYGPRQNAWLLCFAGLTMAFVQGGLIRRLAPRFGEVKLARAGLVVLIPGLVLTGVATSQVGLYGGVFLMAIGAAIVIPSLRALTSLFSPVDRQGEVLGLFSSLGALARAVGPILAGLVYWRTGSEFVYTVGAASLVLPILITLGLRQPEKK